MDEISAGRPQDLVTPSTLPSSSCKLVPPPAYQYTFGEKSFTSKRTDEEMIERFSNPNMEASSSASPTMEGDPEPEDLQLEPSPENPPASEHTKPRSWRYRTAQRQQKTPTPAMRRKETAAEYVQHQNLVRDDSPATRDSMPSEPLVPSSTPRPTLPTDALADGANEEVAMMEEVRSKEAFLAAMRQHRKRGSARALERTLTSPKSRATEITTPTTSRSEGWVDEPQDPSFASGSAKPLPSPATTDDGIIEPDLSCQDLKVDEGFVDHDGDSAWLLEYELGTMRKVLAARISRNAEGSMKYRKKNVTRMRKRADSLKHSSKSKPKAAAQANTNTSPSAPSNTDTGRAS